MKDDGYQLPQDEFNERGRIDSQRQQELLKARYPPPYHSFSFFFFSSCLFSHILLLSLIDEISLISCRYDNNKSDQPEVFNPEQKEWEDNRMQIARLKFGMYS